MRRILLSSVACPAPQHSSTLSDKRYDFQKKKSFFTYNTWFDFLYNFCLQHFSSSSSSSGTELPLVVESYGLLNDIFPFPSILDAGYPIFNLHLANVLFDVIRPSILGSFLWQHFSFQEEMNEIGSRILVFM